MKTKQMNNYITAGPAIHNELLKITHIISKDTTHKKKERRPNGMVQLPLKHVKDIRTSKNQ
jgi:hypothetical protein